MVSRTRSAVLVFIGVMLVAGHTLGQTVIDWTDSDGGNYNSAFSWAGLNIPDSVSESARFDGVNPGNPYNVFFFFNRTVSDLLVEGGDDVVFVRPFGTNTDANYTIDDDTNITGATLTLADAFSTADVNLNIGDELNVRGNGQLNINDGASVETQDLFAGRTASGDGTVIVDGAGSDLRVNGSTIMGSAGSSGATSFINGATGDFLGTITLVSGATAGDTGRLFVTSGASINTADLRVGSLSTAALAVQDALVLVDGSESVLTQTGASTLTVGDADNAAILAVVDIAGGGELNTGTGLTLIQNSGLVRMTSGGTINFGGDVTVDGATLQNDHVPSNGDISTFAPGTTLNVINGGTFSELADRTFTNVTVNVDGTGSVWSGADAVIDGVLTVTNRAMVEMTGDFSVATGGAGMATITGEFTDLVADDVTIGSNGNQGSITFANEGTGDFDDGVTGSAIRVADSAVAGTTGTLTIEQRGSVFADDLLIATQGGATTSGTVTVINDSSRLVQSAGADLVVGHASEGAAVLNISGEATFSTGLYSAGLDRGRTTVHATGAIDVVFDSIFNANGDVIIDGGTMTVDAGSSFNLAAGHTLLVQNIGDFRIAGFHAIDDDTTWRFASGGDMNANNDLDLFVGAFGTDGALIVEDAGSRFALTQSDTFTIGGGGSTGAVTFRNDSSGDLQNLHLARDITAGTTANLNIESGANVSFDELIVGDLGGATTTANILITGDASTLISSGVFLFNAAVFGHADEGSVDVRVEDGGLFNLRNTLMTVNDSATVTIDDGELRSDDAVIIDDGLVHLVSGKVDARTIREINGGRFDFDGGRLSVVDFQGRLFFSSGTFAPGDDNAGTSVVTEYLQSVDGILEIEIGGTDPGVAYDRLIVTTGSVSLGGTLDLRLIDGFVPAYGDSFAIIERLVGGITPGFDTIVGGLQGGVALVVEYDNVTDRVIVNAVIPGDFDMDGDVDLGDFNILAANFSLASGVTFADGDVDQDGDVDLDDFNTFAAFFGFVPTEQVGALPEPGGAVVLIGLALLSGASRRRG